jgi:hypothetical protein
MENFERTMAIKILLVWCMRICESCISRVSTNVNFYFTIWKCQCLSITRLSTECPEGTYKSFIGPTPCQPCPQYSTSHNGSTAPEDCVCRHGEFTILSDQRKCQSYENEELVRLGNSWIGDDQSHKSRVKLSESLGHFSVDMLEGVIGDVYYAS